MAKQPLSHRIHSDPAYRALAKLVGYQGIPYPLSRDESDRLHEQFGREKLGKAADELIEYDSVEKLAKLKATIRKLCFGLLGPAPEDEHWVYRPGEKKLAAASEEIEIVADAIANAIEDETEYCCDMQHVADVTNEPVVPPKESATNQSRELNPDSQSREPKRYAVPPEMTPEAMLQRLTDSELFTLIEEARWGIDHHGPRSRQGRQFKKDVKMAEVECRRRGLETAGPIASPPDVARFQQATTHRLKELLDMAQYEMSKCKSGSVTHEEVVREIGLLEAELKYRKSAQLGGF